MGSIRDGGVIPSSLNSRCTGQGKRNHWFAGCGRVDRENPQGCSFKKTNKHAFHAFVTLVLLIFRASELTNLLTYRKQLDSELIITTAQDTAGSLPCRGDGGKP